MSVENKDSNVFQAFREHGRPTYYHENRTPVTADKFIYGLVFVFLALAFSFYIVLIGIRGKERLYAFIRVTVSLFVGAVILICNFGYGWEYGSVVGSMYYKAFSPMQVKAEIGLKIGLRGINVTLVGIPEKQLNTTINYNERFSWEWSQGRPGNGPQAGRINKEYHAAQIKGLPYPILWAVEYFTIDEGNFRHGRYYRTAGWYCHIALWVAFPLWILSNILFRMVVRYGAYYLALTGGVLLLTTILFASIRNPVPAELRFDSQPLTLSYNWCFYLVLFTGFICVISALVILFMDLRYPEEIAVFFGVDVLQDFEDFYADPADLGLKPPSILTEASSSSIPDPARLERPSQEILTVRKRTVSKRFQRSFRKEPPTSLPKRFTHQSDDIADLPVYENICLKRFDPIGEEDEEANDGSQEQIITSPDEGPSE